MENVKRKYETFRNKYSLPKFSDLIKEFNVNSENPDLILHDIVDKINDRVMSHAKIIESIIFVGTGETASNLFEAKMLRNRRKSIFELYKELMSIKWKGIKIETRADEKEMANFIKDTHEKWIKKLKIEFVNICEEFEKRWKDASLGTSSTETMYLG